MPIRTSGLVSNLTRAHEAARASSSAASWHSTRFTRDCCGASGKTRAPRASNRRWSAGATSSNPTKETSPAGLHAPAASRLSSARGSSASVIHSRSRSCCRTRDIHAKNAAQSSEAWNADASCGASHACKSCHASDAARAVAWEFSRISCAADSIASSHSASSCQRVNSTGALVDSPRTDSSHTHSCQLRRIQASRGRMSGNSHNKLPSARLAESKSANRRRAAASVPVITVAC